MTFSVTDTTTKMNVQGMPNLCRYLREDLVLGNGLSLDQVLKRSGILPRITQGAWDQKAEEMLLLFAESGHPIFRSTTPLSRGQLKSKRKVVYTFHC